MVDKLTYVGNLENLALIAKEQKMKLNELFIGKVDAKNEIMEDTIENKDLFMGSFLLPDNIVLDDFYKRKRYFVLGYKGTGKTALLRYIEKKLIQQRNIQSIFLLFKTDISEDEKKRMAHLARTTLVEQNSNDISEDVSYDDVWMWLIHRLIVNKIETTNSNLFKHNKDLERYINCIHASAENEHESISWIGKFFPSVKRGKIKAGINAGVINAKFGLDLEWGDSNKESINFSSLVKKAMNLFLKLSPGSDELFIFLDELELVYSTKKQYIKDIKLIRDLIAVITRMNEIFKSAGFKLAIVAAIRDEVVVAISSAGREINKAVDDYGVSLRWQQAGGNLEKHPLIQMISQKIAASDKTISCDGVWRKYFPQKINNLPCQEYILRQTWYRPRDIIRFLGIAQKNYPNAERFEQYMFEAIAKDYSSESWVELTEELLSVFSPADMEALKKILTGFYSPFSATDFSNRMQQLGSIYEDVALFGQSKKIGDVLYVLYRVGVIGNTGKRVRFFCRGDNDFDITKFIKIHDPLWNFLSITRNINLPKV